MNAVLAICRKDLRLLCRDRGAIFWAGVFPVLFAVLFGAIFPTSPASKSLAVLVSGDHELASRLAGSGIATVAVGSFAEGRRDVRTGAAIAALNVDANGVDLVVDPTHPAEGAMVEANVMRGLMASASCNVVPFHREGVDGASPASSNGFALAFPAAVLWGLIGCAGAFATASVTERRSGTYLRLRSAPISTRAIIGGKVLACLIASVLDVVVLLAVAALLFHVHIERVSALALAVFSCAICFAGITILLGCAGRSEQSVGGAGWAILLLFAMLGGAMVPLSVMPEWLRALSDVSPVKWGITALEGATVRGLAWRELLPSCLVLVCVGFGSLGSAAFITRRAPA